MAITSLTSTRIGPGDWQLEAVSSLSDPTFYWYEEGVLAASTKLGRRVFSYDDGEQARVQVFDDSGDAPDQGFPGRALLTWYAVTGATSYRVEQWNGSSWDVVATVDGSFRDYYEYLTAWLADETTHTFQVVPIKNGNDGLVRTFVIDMVRRPDRPVVDTTASNYNSGTGILHVEST